MPLTHRAYFCKYRLNVEQYGEILLAQLFKGDNLGDAQRGNDVAVARENFDDVLRFLGVKEKCIVGSDLAPTIRLEVKSKLSETAGGKATVIHCKDVKFDGNGNNGRAFDPMTHLAVVIVRPKDGLIANAWLMTRDVAASLRAMHTKSKYSPVSAVERSAQAMKTSILDLTSHLREIADKQLEIS